MSYCVSLFSQHVLVWCVCVTENMNVLLLFFICEGGVGIEPFHFVATGAGASNCVFKHFHFCMMKLLPLKA